MNINILYASETGKSLKFTSHLSSLLKTPHKILCLSEITPYEILNENNLLIFIISTYFDGKPPTNGQNFYNEIYDIYIDHRIEKNFNFNFAVFGLGSKAYGSDFNIVARNLETWLSSIGGKRILKLGLGDEYSNMEDYFNNWSLKLINTITSNQFEETEEEPDVLEDIEDINKEMVNKTLFKNLNKQGYKIVGSHSAVKLCRWTKSMIKGNGGCYKHTFYGIKSLSCMEITPSLACANKCVFCWRHYTNPVSKSWKWKSDDPAEIFTGLKKEHLKMIKQLHFPGFEKNIQDALTIRHCALSLVGEPIMYPKINELLDILHENKISTFLVTNAQFPEELKNLRNVTQLYLSIDAAEENELKEIDRPLHKDFWKRYLDCIEIIKERKERTVFRLTLVKGKNNSMTENYKELIRKGQPSFIEVKGVTFCGYKNKNEMSMENVPFYKEVEEFCKKIIVGGYEIACVHEHSCCVLIAKVEYKINGKWNTWIDYEKFFDIINDKNFSAINYSCETPDWAIYGAKEMGFDPKEVRKLRK